jgi:heat shock protein HspQ
MPWYEVVEATAQVRYYTYVVEAKNKAEARDIIEEGKADEIDVTVEDNDVLSIKVKRLKDKPSEVSLL